ncbi:hypothetical protein HELRODRAFT_160116 [Helobdella robusta]|uniref:ISXO2-like transposase domain-containing protein n=1 Tax=Helobdella robusta TaxID=6412 RepID=T1EPT8_HELRO|nr:hypothetical protein HELRODRAFT_160116 [Helobdella robusta]ESO06009.1 hypothetical protein HELRODRAFT_160116 [Helobdella robusta]
MAAIYPSVSGISSMQLNALSVKKEDCISWCQEHGMLAQFRILQHSIVDWFNFLRELCSSWMAAQRMQIGGPGDIVQIDESTTKWPDEWRAFNAIGNISYQYDTVNHSRKFKAPSSVHTNKVENLWRCAKDKFKGLKETCDNHLSSYLDEFMWHRSIARKKDKFERTLTLMKTFLSQQRNNFTTCIVFSGDEKNINKYPL